MQKKLLKELNALSRLQARLHKIADGSGNGPLMTAYLDLHTPINRLKEAIRACNTATL